MASYIMILKSVKRKTEAIKKITHTWFHVPEYSRAIIFVRSTY
ncbi:mCG52895, partial [Mus musculus]